MAVPIYCRDQIRRNTSSFISDPRDGMASLATSGR